jgi:iron complex outermembrane receptor protein
MPHSLPLRSLAAACLLTAALPAQSVPPPAAPAAPASDSVVVLSPFEVSTSQDTGYASQDTLSGSRLRTNLKDVAAAISPMTAEFLRDIAATNVEGAIEYGVGTRIDTDDARSAGPVGDGYNDGIRGIRIRGLPGGGRSINFFGAPGEVDMYMTEGLEVSRGPNSILYGFGSPAGRINIASKQATTNRQAYSISNRLDSWGGERWTADANLALIKNQLGLRAVVLRGREQSWRRAGHNDQDRLFLAAKWQPDRKTTIKADFEHGDIRRFVPRPFFGLDMTSLWNSTGQAIFNNYNLALAPGAVGTPGNAFRDTGATAVNGVIEITTNQWVAVSSSYPYAQNFRNFTRSEAPAGGVQGLDFARGLSNPEAVLEANWSRGSFRTNYGSIIVQRELLRDLNLEAGFNRQTSRTVTHNLATWNWFGVTADTNRYLPNGQLKPAGNLYYFDVSPDHRPSSSQVSQGRLTLSYEKKLHELATLRMAGLGEMASTKSRSEILQQYWKDGPTLGSASSFHATPENASNQVYYRYYLKDLSVLDDPNFRIPAPYDLSGATKYQDPATGAVRDIYMQEFNRSQGNIGYVNRDTGAYMGVVQAFLLKNRLVGTYGYRKDRLKSRNGLAYRDPAAEAVALNTGVWLPADPKTAKPSVFSGQTQTLGGVLHLTSWFSAFYNTSNSLSTPGTNFITPADPANSVIADYVKAPSGNTDDYGIKLSLLKNRLSVTATKYHTVSKNEFGFSGFNKTNVVNIWNAIGNSGALDAAGTAFALRQGQIMNQVVGYMQDSESKGYEFEILGQPLPGWSVSLNYSRNETLRSNMATEYRAYLDQYKPEWLKYRDFSLTQTATPGVERAANFADWRTPAEVLANGDVTINTDSINEAIADAEALFYDNPRAFEGKRFVGDPLHNFNVRTRYEFRDGWLKGFTIGAGGRLRTGRIAGARTDFTYASGSSFTDTWNGRVTDSVTMVETKDQKVYDLQLGYSRSFLNRKLRWNIQLNVNNLTNQRELVVNNVNPRTLVPLTYRYQDPRQYILTNTFSF